MRSFLWLYQSKISCGLLLGLIFLTLPPSALAECTARKNTLGHLNYHCTDGNKGQIRKNALGNWQDKKTGTIYRKTPLGTLQGSDGSQYRKDALGNYRSNDGKVYRKDALGDWRSGSR